MENERQSNWNKYIGVDVELAAHLKWSVHVYGKVSEWNFCSNVRPEREQLLCYAISIVKEDVTWPHVWRGAFVRRNVEIYSANVREEKYIFRSFHNNNNNNEQSLQLMCIIAA